MKNRMGFFITLSAAFAVMVAVPIWLSGFFGYDICDDDNIIARTNDYHEAKDLLVHMTEDKDNEWSFEVDRLWGAFAMKYFTTEENAVYSFDCDLEKSKGDFKLVLVNMDSNEVVASIYDEDKDLNSVTAELAPASYAVKAVGRRAQTRGEFHINAE